MTQIIFGRIKDLDPLHPDSWNNRAFITLDVDWACDEVLADSIDLLENADVAATWFITHDTPLLKRLRDNPKFELGIHPNFNYLLDGDGRNGRCAAEVVDRVLEIVPDACSVRSHSMTQNSKLLDLFVDRGLTHDVNHFVPHTIANGLPPWKLWNGLVKVPYEWEDDVHFLDGKSIDLSAEIRANHIRTLDFHPIHIYLNAEQPERYERTRAIHRDPEALLRERNPGIGTRTLLQSLLR